MKLSLSVIALSLSIMALAVSVFSVVQPIYNSYVAQEASKNKPSFDMPVSGNDQNFYFAALTTNFFIVNNGSATAHDVHVLVSVYGYDNRTSVDFNLEQYIPTIAQGQGHALTFPIGYMQIEVEYAHANLNYVIDIDIDCKEVPNVQTFEFNINIPPQNSP
jgi:hypothetical protein